MGSPKRKSGKGRKAPAKAGRSAFTRLGAAALSIVALAALYGAANGSLGTRLNGLAGAATDTALSAIGLTVGDVTVRGRRFTRSEDLLAALAVRRGDPIHDLDLNAARSRIVALHWVREASVSRLFPDTIHVSIDEHQPFAIWRRRGNSTLVDDRGALVDGLDPKSFSDLPVIAGTGAPEAAPEFLTMLSRRPAISARVVASLRVGERRWTLKLDNGVDVLLPEERVEIALDELVRLHETTGLLDRDVTMIDVRLVDRITVRPRKPDDENAALGSVRTGNPPAKGRDT